MKRETRYPGTSYRRLYDPAAGPLWTPEVGLPPEADGDHYREERDFFEWWYFDAAFDSGYRLVAILHSSLYNAVDHKPTVDLRVTPPQGASTIAIERYDRADYQAAGDHCDVQIAVCRAAAKDAGCYDLHLRQGEIAADLVYESDLPGWQPGTGYLFLDETTGHFFRWVVPVPRATVAGTLTVNGQKMAVQGVGYHDHNWGNLVLADAFSHWYWGRLFSNSGETVVFGDVVSHGSDPSHVRPFLIVAAGEILPGEPEVTIQSREPIADPITGVRYPMQLELTAATPHYQASVSLEAGRVMEALDFASPPFRRRWLRGGAEIAFYLTMNKPVIGSLTRRLLGKGSYLRLQAEASVHLQASRESHFGGDAIFEIMRFH